MNSDFVKPDSYDIERRILAYRPRVVELHPKEMLVRLIRLASDDYARLRRSSIPIKEDASFYFAFLYTLRQRDGELNLAQIYAALVSLFGETSHLYDDYKGSFAFPLFLHLRKGEQSYPYLLRINDYKGALEFNFYRVVARNDHRYDRSVYHEPFAEEFAREEINYFRSYLYGFLEGYFSVVGAQEGRPFFRAVPAIFVIYGWENGHFFETQYESDETYRAALDEFEAAAIGSLWNDLAMGV